MGNLSRHCVSFKYQLISEIFYRCFFFIQWNILPSYVKVNSKVRFLRSTQMNTLWKILRYELVNWFSVDWLFVIIYYLRISLVKASRFVRYRIYWLSRFLLRFLSLHEAHDGLTRLSWQPTWTYTPIVLYASAFHDCWLLHRLDLLGHT